MKFPQSTPGARVASILCLGIALAASAATGATLQSGLMVERVTPESLGARAGLQEGDLLLSWCRTADSAISSCAAEGRFESPFDFDEVDLEQAPRGGVRILGERAGASITWALLPGAQSVEVRPLLPESLLRIYEEGRSFAGERPKDAVERWRAASVRAQQTGEERLAVWFLSRGAETLAEARQWPQADELYGEAVDQLRSLREEKIETRILKAWGKTFQSRGIWDKAEDLYRRSLELDRAAGRELAVAGALHSLGTIAAQRSDLQEAETLLRQALEILERLAPRSSSLALGLKSLGNTAQARGDLPLAKDLFLGAISIQEKLAPESLEMASLLIDLGGVRSVQDTAHEEAEKLYSRARAICERIQPESLEKARALRMLGILATYRLDREAAAYFLEHALEIEERLDASGADKAHTLQSLGLQAHERGDRKQAIEYLRRAMDLNEKLAPDGKPLALNLQNLGVIEIREGQCAAAEAHFQRALAIRKKLNPDSLDVAKSFKSLGFLGIECGDLAKAEESYRRALTIQERLAPGTPDAVRTLHDLGEVFLRQGRSPAAVEPLCRAADLADSRHGNTDRTNPLSERFFTDCAEALIANGRTVEAFHVQERGRARTFLAHLAERDSMLSSDLPEELVRRRRELGRELESTQGALARLSSTRDAADVEHFLGRLREIRDQQRELTAQIRKSSPRPAFLQYPEPLDLAGSRRALDPGTALLAYLVGEEKSFLFVVEPPDLADPGLSVFTLPIGRKALGETIESFRNLLQNAESDPSSVTARAKDLYELLIRPAEARITAATRLLVAANGPLQTLPFAALVRGDRYLVEWKPIHSVLSATVYAELKKARRLTSDPEKSRIVAFGAPAYPRLATERDVAPPLDPEILTAVQRGLSLDPIPSTRQEIETIAKLFPQTQTYLGREATEERVKTVGSQARILHFACHGLLDERFPLDSALALTIPRHPAEGQDNGLLHAWEIMESVRLDADLVTLSACDTALGRQVEGDGLIGLTRAFQYAGARSVLASLWSVSDVSTADLMKRFYGHLRAGKWKDDSLQAAQVALIRSPEFSHPYHWAAFQLVGDWK